VTRVLAVAPALPPGKAAPYVTGAYIVFLALVLVYVAIMATRLSATERDLAALRRDVQAREDADEPGTESGVAAEPGRKAEAESGTQPKARREREAERVR